MTREEYNKFIDNLEKQGYKCGNEPYESPYHYKVLEWLTVKDGKERAVCKLLFNLYDFSGFAEPEDYFYEPVIYISRNTDEHIALTLSSPELSVEEYERIAIEFLKFIDNNIKPK